MPTHRSLQAVKMGDWYFKASESEGNICIVAYSPRFQHSVTRFFTSENEAHNWVDYLVMTSEMIEKHSNEKDT